jgi:two-component system response regulator DevR
MTTAGTESHPIKVLIVEDSPLVRAGLRAVLSDENAIEIVGEAATAEEAFKAVESTQPAVVLLDIRLPDGTGIGVCERVRHAFPDVRMLMLSSLDDDRIIQEALNAGASGYLLKENDGPALVSAITRVAAGESVVDPRLAGSLIRLATSDRRTGDIASLSKQENNVLALIAEGKTNKEIGSELSITEKTVKNYVSNIFDKLNVSRRSHAVALFISGGK